VAKLLAQIAPPPVTPAVAATSALPSLFEGDFEFATTALRHLEKHPLAGESGLSWERDEKSQALRIHAPKSFLDFRAEFLPDEALPAANKPFQLVASHAVVGEKIREALEGDDGAWPEWHLLWEQHPLIEWVLDTLSAAYARHEAPVLLVPSLEDSSLFLFSTLVSNEDSEPVHTAWFAVGADGQKVGTRVLSLEDAFKETGLQKRITNREPSKRAEVLQTLVPEAVTLARAHVKTLREPALNERRKLVRRESRRLAEWETKVEAVLSAREARYRKGKGAIPLGLERKLNQERENVKRFKQNHQEWLTSLSAHGADAYVRLAAVFSGK
jgi:hypothetical protein